MQHSLTGAILVYKLSKSHNSQEGAVLIDLEPRQGHGFRWVDDALEKSHVYKRSFRTKRCFTSVVGIHERIGQAGLVVCKTVVPSHL